MAPRAQFLALAACGACLLSYTEASVHKLSDDVGPGLFYLHGRHKFFAAAGSSNQGGMPTAQLSDLKFRWADAEQKPKADDELYLEIGMVPLKEFTELVQNNVSICTEAHDFAWGAAQGAVSQHVYIDRAVTTQLKLTHGGPHMLVVANCRVPGRTTLSGSITVQNSWGFLDSVEYWKMPIYICASLGMLLAILIYVFMVTQQDEDVRDMQYYCILLSIMGLAEAVSQCVVLWMENAGMETWGQVVEALYLAKLMYGLTFMLQIAQGLGFTTHRLDCMGTTKCYVVVILYLLAAMPKICLLSARPHLAALSQADLLKAAAPVVAVTSLTLCWVVWALGRTLRQLRKRDDVEAVQAYRRIAILFAFMAVGGALVLAAQLSTSAEAGSVWVHAFWNDAVASATFCTATCVMMYLSMENYVGKSLQMGTLPTDEPGMGQNQIGSQIDTLDDDDDEEDARALGIQKDSPTAQAQTIGAAAGAE